MSNRIRVALLALALLVPAQLGCLAVSPAGAVAATARAQHAGRVRLAALTERQTSLVGFARRLLGVPYTYGGASPQSGFDCSGFTRFVFAHFGITLPHSSVAQFQLGRSVEAAALRPGDLVFFDGLGHVGLYIGGGEFIHAPHSGTTVSVDSLSGWYASRYDGARRLI